MHNLIKKHAEKLRFAIVGGLNTLIDFGILFSLVALGLPTLPSNIISTSVALIFSFFANKSFTFKAGGKISSRQVGLFLGITLVGLWVIQPILIETVQRALASLNLNSFIVLFIGKLIATIATLIWNYLLYRRFVFKKV